MLQCFRTILHELFNELFTRAMRHVLSIAHLVALVLHHVEVLDVLEERGEAPDEAVVEAIEVDGKLYDFVDVRTHKVEAARDL
jgi:hypothetical protein